MSASVVGASSSEALLCYKITTLPFLKKKNMVTLKNTLFCGKAADMLMSRVNITQVKVRNMPYIRFYDRYILYSAFYFLQHFTSLHLSSDSLSFTILFPLFSSLPHSFILLCFHCYFPFPVILYSLLLLFTSQTLSFSALKQSSIKGINGQRQSL